ncbi:uncharacterized protein [Palaemon carinicauda]
MAAPLAEPIVFQDILLLGFGPMLNKSRISISGKLVGEKAGSESISIVWDSEISGNITFYGVEDKLVLVWPRTGNWSLIQLQLIKRTDAKRGQHPYALLATAGNMTKACESSLEPPLAIHINKRGASNATKVFFNCPLECQINQNGLDKEAGRTTFYLWREEEFNSVEVHPEGLQAVKVLPEQVPVLRHWYKVDVQGNVQSILILVDGVPQPIIHIPEVIPHFTDMTVTVNGSAKVSWCPPHYPTRSDPGHRTVAVVSLIALAFVSILTLSFRAKLNHEIKNIQQSRKSQPSVVFRKMPFCLAQENIPPPAPAPPIEKVGLNKNYSDPCDLLPQDYADLVGEITEDELHRNSNPITTIDGDCFDDAIGENNHAALSAKSSTENENSEDPYDELFYPVEQPVEDHPYSTTVCGIAQHNTAISRPLPEVTLEARAEKDDF